MVIQCEKYELLKKQARKMNKPVNISAQPAYFILKLNEALFIKDSLRPIIFNKGSALKPEVFGGVI
jgi:hypothetical protein